MSDLVSELRPVDDGDVLFEIDGLTKYFRSESGLLASLRGGDDVEAVDDVSFDIRAGETLALVGESGCGKSTLARTVLQLLRPTAGSVRYRGVELTEHSDAALRPLRRNMQMIFQDPQASLDPRMKVGQIVEEPMRAHDLPADEARPDGASKRAARRERAMSLLETVGLKREYYNRYPHEFSGGQRQRLNLARALSTNPDFVLCDEPVSALDVSVQAQVLNTMDELQEEFGLTYLFISHDLSVVRYVADRVAVMYLGHVVELGETQAVFDDPRHPYTKALLDAIPVPDPRRSTDRTPIDGDVPSPIDPPSGCRFRTRCPKLIDPGAVSFDERNLDDSVADYRLDTYDLDEIEWADTRGFVRAVDRRSFALPESADASACRAAVESMFFDGSIPDGEAGSAIDDAIDRLVADEWESAATLLRNTFSEQSICAAVEPTPAPADASGHRVGCHLFREE
ncbi:ABC transporter ATP-binding protein [Halovivax cerinus]|uniref:ABC transporter ATP-binding protein n=1 Tax=Halovivax cerinus TaxID=1487865 RepID=A0ABD5NM12_9EURY|nr:oligopeptide/dipeptide ABC transporter ATP-binding protein [Halovivax cerinus]